MGTLTKKRKNFLNPLLLHPQKCAVVVVRNALDATNPRGIQPKKKTREKLPNTGCNAFLLFPKNTSADRSFTLLELQSIPEQSLEGIPTEKSRREKLPGIIPL
jgi:hypothetical protein